MVRPGLFIRRWAVRVLPETTIQRVVDPILADWQTEYEEAASGPSPWKCRWVRYSGYGILLRALLVYGCFQLAAPWQGWSSDERGSASRMVGMTIVATAVLTALLMFRPARDLATQFSDPTIILTLIPQAVPTAAPLGLLLGILYATHGGRLSRRVIRGSVLASVVVSVASYVLLSQIVPAANMTYRIKVFQQLQPGFDPSILSRGPAEMTFSDLRRRIDQDRRSGFGVESARRLERILQERRALAAAALPLAVFALVIGTRRRYGLAALWAIGAGVAATFYALMNVSDQLTRSGAMPILAVWLPHLTVLAVSALLLRGRSREAPLSADAQ